MNSWFPFTDYDFYAYLTTGLTVLFSLDYALNDGAIMLRDSWPFMQIVFGVAISYLLGQMLAGFSATFLEHWLARRVLQPPITVMLALEPARARERFIGRWVVGRYYEPLPEGTRACVLNSVAASLKTQVGSIQDPEQVFQVAFPTARSVADTATRLDDFRKLYGFSRNMSLAFVIAAAALVYRGFTSGDEAMYGWAATLVLSAVALFGRFLKFYVAYSADVLRTYAHVSAQGKS